MQNRFTQDYGDANAKLSTIFKKYQVRLAGQDVYKGSVDVDFYKLDKALNTAQKSGSAFGQYLKPYLIYRKY